MKINDYQQKALRTMNWDLNLHDKIVDCAAAGRDDELNGRK